MFKEIKKWLVGIFEDDPIPYEVINLYFALHKENNYVYISFGGTELPLKQLINFEYYPLEAQFFNVYLFDKNFNITKLKSLVEKLLLDKDFINIFNKKTLFIGIFGKKEIYFV